MGFEGDSFLNCVVWVRSSMPPSSVLGKILAIEKQMGRELRSTKKHRSRIIDIDIVLIDDLITESKNLTVPHPEIEHRKFVLHPLSEVNPNVRHPVHHEKIIELQEKTVDTSNIEKISKWLTNPQKEYDVSSYNYIAIEGNIGAGKTSLASRIANDFNAKLILERFKDNPFLPKFYEDQRRYAFPLEMSFLADRYQQLLEDIKQFDLFKDFVIADYDVFKSLIFAKVTLQVEEYELYKKLFHIMHKELPRPDVYIYLYQNTDRLLENIMKRGREYEKSIEGSYLAKINEGYLEFIKNQHTNTIKVIDISGMDFISNRKDYLAILKKIKE
jgi:deoxyadenosine/deoxycytidine kinase/7,8-dihydro-6-hydroxymethylpterin-pyrophosphokinase